MNTIHMYIHIYIRDYNNMCIYSYVYMCSLAYAIRLLFYMCNIFMVEPGRNRFAESASRLHSLLLIAGREMQLAPLFRLLWFSHRVCCVRE